MFTARSSLLAMVLAMPPLWAAAQAPDGGRCDRLSTFYERYAGRITHGNTPSGRLERELGDAECRKGNHAAGIRLLEEAIRKAGFTAPTP